MDEKKKIGDAHEPTDTGSTSHSPGAGLGLPAGVIQASNNIVKANGRSR